MSQTSVSQNMTAAFAGLLDGIGANVIDTYPAGDTVPLGRLVANGAFTPNTVLVASGPNAGLTAIGFSVAGKKQQTTGGSVDYARGEPVPVLKMGRLWALAAKSIPINTLLRVQQTSGLLTDEANPTDLTLANLRVRALMTTTAAGLILVEVYHV
jgi:hypothetical protein